MLTLKHMRADGSHAVVSASSYEVTKAGAWSERLQSGVTVREVSLSNPSGHILVEPDEKVFVMNGEGRTIEVILGIHPDEYSPIIVDVRCDDVVTSLKWGRQILKALRRFEHVGGDVSGEESDFGGEEVRGFRISFCETDGVHMETDNVGGLGRFLLNVPEGYRVIYGGPESPTHEDHIVDHENKLVMLFLKNN